MTRKWFVHVQYSNNVNFFWIFCSVVGWIHRYRTWGYRGLIILWIHCLMRCISWGICIISSILIKLIRSRTLAIVHFQIRNLRFVCGCVILNPGVITWTHDCPSDIWVLWSYTLQIFFLPLWPTPANWVLKGLSTKSPSPSISMPGAYK